jgi:hypothetical protein
MASAGWIVLAVGLAGCGRSGGETAVAGPGTVPDVATGIAAFAADEGGQLAREKLVPARPDAADDQAAATAPRPWKAAKLDRLPTAGLPTLELKPEPRRLPQEAAARQDRTRTAPEQPPLASAQDLPAPARPETATGALTAAAGPDPNRVPVAPLTPPPPAGPAADPAQEAARQAVLGPVPTQRNQPAPPVRLTIPDPFEATAPLRLPAAPETPEPQTPTNHPPRPPLTAR